MPYDAVENLVGDLLRSLGYTNVQISKRGADGGVDLRAARKMELGSLNYLVQVKRYKRNVSVDVVRALRGCLSPGEHGIVITTSAFTRPAQLEAQETGRAPIWLVDGVQLTDLMVEQGIGVRKLRPLILEPETGVIESSLDVESSEPIHNPLQYHSRYSHTPRGRRIEIPVTAHFDKQRSLLLPVFSVLAGAALRVCPEVDYFAVRDSIIFATGTDNQRSVALLVKVQVQRLVVCLRLPSDIAYTERLHRHTDRGWYKLQHKVFVRTPSDIDDEMRLWLKIALCP